MGLANHTIRLRAEHYLYNTTELRAFAKGLLKDAAAVRAGLSLIWSNGPTEGFIHRLKLIKRQAYGRAGVDFLRHRILPPSAGMAA
jgi:transposase